MLSILPQPLLLALKQLQTSLLPGSCLLCGADSKNHLLCQNCTKDLPPLPEYRCPQCNEQTTHGERCGACLKDPPAFERSFACFRYEFPVDRIIHAFKYGHQLAVAQWAAEIMVKQLANNSYDLLIPMPLHPDRLRERGFNQSAEIARVIACETKQTLNIDALIRNRATPPQAELPMKERTRNVRGAFECGVDLSGKRVLLIDDVMTTGATLREASRILKLHGATYIDVASLARAYKH
ncbi:MAG: ComF family protein [Azonexus sp.]